MSNRYNLLCSLFISILFWHVSCLPSGASENFNGEFYSGTGNTEFLCLLDTARRMFSPDPQYQNITMLYSPDWNGFVEGPTWNSWWIQNSYGTTFAALPFFVEPCTTFLQNAQDNWFKFQGDGKTRYTYRNFTWIVPDGQLVDCASDRFPIHKQGDGNVAIHDWPIEFTAAGIIMQSELLLISRDQDCIAYYLLRLERAADFVDSRRDPNNNLFLAGPAANLLAPSYAGFRHSDGTFGPAYLAGISITYCAALDRLVELEKLAGRTEKARRYSTIRELIKKSLPLLLTKEGYFVRSIDPDGTRHGVYGASKYGYFESVPNHDAVCFRIVDDRQSELIYDKITSIPQLRPHGLIIPNYPAYDDMYVENPTGLWNYGRWVNGGHWSSCEARMIIAYMRLGKYNDAANSMKAILKFAREFRMDNPLEDSGGKVHQFKEPINCTYDAFAIPAAFIRGLFEYVYSADSVTLYPHLPPTVTSLQQIFPIRFGTKRFFIATAGSGPITSVMVNGRKWPHFDANSIILPYTELPERSTVKIAFGSAAQEQVTVATITPRLLPADNNDVWKFDWCTGAGLDSNSISQLKQVAAKISILYEKLEHAGLADTYEGAHARTILETIAALYARTQLCTAGKLEQPAEKTCRLAANALYVKTALKLAEGLNQRAILPSVRPSSLYPHSTNLP
jgi:hypothetical protein